MNLKFFSDLIKEYGPGLGVPIILLLLGAWAWLNEKPNEIPLVFVGVATGWAVIAGIVSLVKWYRNRPVGAVKTPEGKFGIYVARFQNDQGNARQRELFYQLHEAIENESELRKQIEVHDLCQPVSHGTPDDQARWLQVIARPVNATLIIWVEETHTSKRMYRTVVHREPEEGFTPKAERIPEKTELLGHIKALAYTMLGMSDEAVKQLPSRAEDPHRFTAQLGDIGNMLLELPTGNRTNNLNRAIGIFNNLLEAYVPERFPEEWAGLQNNLGVAHRNLPVGDRTHNSQKAIECYEAALTVYTKDAFTDQWAMTQNNIGIVYGTLPTGDITVNLKKAITAYKAALTVYTKDALPADWAMTLNNLGNAYRNLLAGDRPQNLLKAIDCYESALTVYTNDTFPDQWAMTQNNLGNAYSDLPPSDHAENLLKAIDAYQAALTIYTKDIFPADWAMTQNNIGIAYAQLSTGDPAENLLKAIDCFEVALTVLTKEDFPDKWGTTQNNLGNAYALLLTGDRAENLQKAIDCFEAALTVLTEAAFPHDNAMAIKNLQIARDELAELE